MELPSLDQLAGSPYRDRATDTSACFSENNNNNKNKKTLALTPKEVAQSWSLTPIPG